MIQQSCELAEFYKAYAAWLEADAPVWNENNFDRGRGLCSNMTIFGLGQSCLLEMMRQFEDSGLCRSYPFSNGHFSNYFIEANAEHCHLNHNRRQWVFAHAKD